MQELNYWTRLQQRVSRRTALRGAAIGTAGLAGAALIGCGSEDDPATPGTPAATGTPAGGTPAAGGGTPAPQSEVRTGGTLRDGATGVIAGADPHNSVYHGAGIVRQVYTNLVRSEVLRADLGTHDELAESHEVSGDGTTWVFTIRPDAVVSPNDQNVPERPLDAEDAVASFDRMKDPANAANILPLFLRWVDSYEAPDPQTFRIVTRAPFGWMLGVLGDSLQGAIVPREFLEQGEAVRATAVGAGPFMVDRMVEQQEFVLNKNPNFYEEGKPYLDAYRRVIFQDQATYRTGFASGQVDTFATSDVQEAAELARSVQNVTHLEHGSTGYNSFWMRTDAPPWNDERVRRAMNRAMDREQYVAIIGKGAGRPMGPLAPVFEEYALPQEELAQLQPHDPDDARALFDAAGVSEISFVYPTSSNMPDYVNIMVQQLQNVGIEVRPEPLDAGTWVSGYFQSQHAASFSLNQAYKTPDAALLWYRSGGVTGGGQYSTQYYSEELDQQIDEAASLLDHEERVEAYLELQRAILASDPAFINVFNVAGNSLFSNRVRDLSPGPGAMHEFLYKQVWLES